MKETLRNACRDVLKNIYNDTSEDSYEASSQKGESDEENYVCLKALKEDDIEETSLTHT